MNSSIDCVLQLLIYIKNIIEFLICTLEIYFLYYNFILLDKYLLLVFLFSHAEFGEYFIDEIVFEFFANDLAKRCVGGHQINCEEVLSHSHVDTF